MRLLLACACLTFFVWPVGHGSDRLPFIEMQVSQISKYDLMRIASELKLAVFGPGDAAEPRSQPTRLSWAPPRKFRSKT